MKDGDGKHLTILHLFTNYKISDKPIMELTNLQYNAILVITNEIMKYKSKNKPVMVI